MVVTAFYIVEYKREQDTGNEWRTDLDTNEQGDALHLQPYFAEDAAKKKLEEDRVTDVRVVRFRMGNVEFEESRS